MSAASCISFTCLVIVTTVALTLILCLSACYVVARCQTVGSHVIHTTNDRYCCCWCFGDGCKWQCVAQASWVLPQCHTEGQCGRREDVGSCSSVEQTGALRQHSVVSTGLSSSSSTMHSIAIGVWCLLIICLYLAVSCTEYLMSTLW